MNKVDLIFQKQPQQVKEKLMDLLIQYNAVMQYNANDDKFQVDLLIPFISEQQKQQFLKGFYKSRDNREFQHTMTIGQYSAELYAKNKQQQQQQHQKQKDEAQRQLLEKQQSLQRVLSDESFEKKNEVKVRSRKNTQISKNRNNKLNWSQAKKGSNVSHKNSQSSHLKKINYQKLAQTMQNSINEALAQITLSKKFKRLNEDPALNINYYNYDNNAKRNQQRSLIQDLQNISDKGLALYQTEDVRSEGWDNAHKQEHNNPNIKKIDDNSKRTQYKHSFHSQKNIVQPLTPQFQSQNQELRHIPNKFKNQYKDYANYYTHIENHKYSGNDSKGSLIQQESSLNQVYQPQINHDQYLFAHQDNSSQILIEDSPKIQKNRWNYEDNSGQGQYQQKFFRGTIQENIQDDEQQFDHANKFRSVRQTQKQSGFKKNAKLYEKKQTANKKSKSPHSSKKARKSEQLSFEQYKEKSNKNKTSNNNTNKKRSINAEIAMQQYNQALKQVKERSKNKGVNEVSHHEQNYMRQRSAHLSPHSKLRSKYNNFLKENYSNMEHLYGNIRQDIKDREYRNQQGDLLLADQSSQQIYNAQQPLYTPQQKAFKQEVHAQYVQKIVKNEQLSSEDLIRYFRYLLKNAKELYNRQGSRRSSQLY